MLFSGKTTPSSIIKRLTLSRWSHVGMVLRSPDADRSFFWESLTASVVPDALDGELKRGVMTVDLATRLRADAGDLAVRRLNRPVTAEMAQRVWSLHEALADRPYEESLTELVRSGSRGLIVDLRHVAYISSAGFRALLIAAQLGETSRCALALCGIGSEVRRMFEMGAFDQVFTILATREECVAHLAAASTAA